LSEPWHGEMKNYFDGQGLTRHRVVSPDCLLIVHVYTFLS